MRAWGADTPVVTGAGLVTALGAGRRANAESLRASRSGVREVDGVAVALCEEPYLRVEVSRELEAQQKFLNGAGELAVTAADEAWGDAGWREADVAPERKGLWLSQMDAWDWNCIEMRGGFSAATEAFEKPLPEGVDLNKAVARYTKPFFLLESLKNNAFSFLANLFELKGANTSVAGFSAATHRLLDVAARAVRRGSLDRALVVAAGRIANGMGVRDLDLHGLRARADRAAAVAPLDEEGRGVAPGEGAAALALERQGDAAARGATPHAALLANVAVTGSPLAGHASPEAASVRRAAELALAEAEAAAGEIAAVVLPALGIPEAERALLEGIAAVPMLDGVPVTSYRGATGHMALASDLADLVLALDVLASGTVPATVGTGKPLAPSVTTTVVETKGRAVLVLSAGLLGEVGALVLDRGA